MHGHKKMHGGDLNENCNFNGRKVVMYGYKRLRGGDLNENESFKEGTTTSIYVIFWDRRFSGIEGLA